MQVLDQVDRVQHAVERSRDVGDHRSCRDRQQDRVATHELESLDDLAADRSRCRSNRPCGLGRPDQEQAHRRERERHRVDEQRERRAHCLDERTGQARPADLRQRRARRQLAVALDDPVDPDQRRDVRRISGVEQGAQARLDERDDVELLHAQDPGHVGDRDRQQEQRPQRVGPDQERPASHPVGPCPGDQPHEEHGEAGRHHERGHLPRARAENQQGQERHRGSGHDRAELGHGLTSPQLEKVGVSPEGRGCHGRRRLAAREALCLPAWAVAETAHAG